MKKFKLKKLLLEELLLKELICVWFEYVKSKFKRLILRYKFLFRYDKVKLLLIVNMRVVVRFYLKKIFLE